MIVEDWVLKAAQEVAQHWTFGSGPDSYVTEGQRAMIAENIATIIRECCPFKPDVAYEEVRRDGPLLQCIDCKNTESPAGAMARYFNQGRCMHCGGYFKVVRA